MKLNNTLEKQLLLLIIFGVTIIGSAQNEPTTKWTINPFDKQIFIENVGQVGMDVKKQAKDSILYIADLGSIHAFFTKSGIVYKQLEYHKRSNAKEDEEEEEEHAAPIVHYFRMGWNNPNTDIKIETESKQTYHYAFANSEGKTVSANVYKKLTYHNLYQGIDIEYYFPEGKQGIEYSVIIHSGADASQVKLIYQGAKSLQTDFQGEVLVSSSMGVFTDHAPVTYYEGDKNDTIKSLYIINGKEESFKIDNYDKTRTIVIDPWTTNPGFTGSVNAANDVDYDYGGNVYAYGSYGPVQVAKLNSAGVVQWVFSAPTTAPYGPFSYQYGGFCVDRTTGDCFISEACGAGGLKAGAKTIKISTAGVVTGFNKGDSVDSFNEVWKSVFDQCNKQVILAGGGAYSTGQAAVLDATGMTFVTKSTNILGGKSFISGGNTLYYLDLFGVTIDPAGGTCYFGSTTSNLNPSPNCAEMLLKTPTPALSPTAYKKPLGFGSGIYPYIFHEGYINGYSPNNTSVGNPNSFSNSFNGIAAGYQNWVYLSDGTTLTQYDKATGAQVKILTIYNWTGIPSQRADSIRWGGLDVDQCENIYAGVRDSINVYNSSLFLNKKIAVKDTIYGLRIGPNNLKTGTQLLYACGLGYVSQLTVPSYDTVTLTIIKNNANKCKCDGSATAKFRETCGDTSNISYAWSNGETTQTAINLCPGIYTCTVSLGKCKIVQYQDTVTITAPPGSLTLTKTSTPVKCNGGKNGTASVKAIGGTWPYTYSWAPGTGTTDSLSNLTAGSYTCTVNDAGGCSDTVIITITQPKALAIITTVNPAACGNPTGSMGASVTGGTGAYNYVWSPGGNTNTSATNIPAGTYSVNITDGNGCKDSATVTVTNSPSVAANINPVMNVLCYGSNTGSAIVNVSTGTVPYTYLWSNGQTSSGAHNLGAGTYTVTVTDKNGCVTKDSTVITQPSAITVTTSSTAATCGQSNGSAAVIASGGKGSYTYSWAPGSGTTVAVNNIPAGTYTVTVTDSNSCSAIDTVTINSMSNDTVKIIAVNNVKCYGQANGSASVVVTGGAGPYVYSWSSGQSTSTVTAFGVGSYTVKVTDKNGCISSDSVSITQPTRVMPNVGPNQAICIGKPAVINASASGGVSPYTYTWSTGATTSTITVFPTTTSSYAVEVTDSNGCLSPPVTVTVTVRPALSATATATGPICVGDTATLSAAGHGGDSTYTFNWMPGNKTGASIAVTPAVSTSYTVTVTDGCADTVKDSVQVTIMPSPTINFTADTLNGCSPLCVQFHDMTTSAGGISSWSWTFGDGSTSTSQNPTHCFTDPGNYNVNLAVTSNSGCKASQNAPGLITVYSHPKAAFTYSPSPVTVMEPLVQFTDMSTDAYGINNWVWLFGDSYGSTDQNPTHSYTDSGKMCASLTVTNEHGCTADTTECIDVEPIFIIYIPNAFTPNGDGLNEVFTAKGVGIKSFEMWIFDRWGQQLYHVTDMSTGWNGTVQGGTSGQIVQEDTYVYLIEVNDVFNKSHRYVGRVSVIK